MSSSPHAPKTSPSRQPCTPASVRPHPDLRGTIQLATEATIEAAHLAEGVHGAVLSALRLASDGPVQPTRGLTGWIYRTIRRVAGASGFGMATVLQRMERATESALPPDPKSRSEPRRRLLSALNGVLGDHLAETENPLARSFSLRTADGSPLPPNAAIDGAAIDGPVIVFVHGLCLDDRNWMAAAGRTGHVDALSEAVSGTPLLARYNTGRPVVANGRRLSRHLEAITERAPQEPHFVMVAHSMGGLVVRTALAAAQQTSARWPGQVRDVIYLGTPHHGAPLEQIGAWVERCLGWSRFTRPFTALTGLRSRGIRDLRRGAAAETDAAHVGSSSGGLPAAPPSGRCLYVGGDLAPDSVASEQVGDGLVPVSSALNRHPDCQNASSHRIVPRVSHFDLLHHPTVTGHLADWLTGRPASALKS